MTKPERRIRPQARTLSMLAAAVSAIMLATGLSAPAGQAAGSPAAGPQTAAQKFKNIQVLKDIPADQLIPTMQFITASLGVECDFCHVERQFDKDDKEEKKTARSMMQMMFAINQGNFKGEREVTCNTCHRGSPHPQAIPAILAESATPPAMEAMHEHDTNPDTWPSGAPVVEKFIQAVGGQAALDKVSSRVEEGRALMPEGPATAIDIYTKSPDERVSVMHTPKGDSVTAYNGHAGWIAFPGRPLREMSAADQQAAKLDAEAFYPAQLEHEFAELKLQPQREKVGTQDTNVVVASAKGQPPVKLYFAKDSGLLLRMVHYADTALGFNPTQVDFADYRDVKGVKTPFRWTIARPSGAFTIQLEKVEQNVPIDENKFVEPKAESQPTGSGHDGAPGAPLPPGPKPPQGSVPAAGSTPPPSGDAQ